MSFSSIPPGTITSKPLLIFKYNNCGFTEIFTTEYNQIIDTDVNWHLTELSRCNFKQNFVACYNSYQIKCLQIFKRNLRFAYFSNDISFNRH